jgi:hypothetical protein
MIKLSVIIPGIRTQNWQKIYESVSDSLIGHSFEVIAIGPNLPSKFFDDKLNFRYVRDFGHPSRCLQIASILCSGEYLCWLPDDIILEQDSLGKCIEFMSDKSPADGMTFRYSEGQGFTGSQDKDDSYWIGWTHQDQRFAHVNKDWKIAPVFLYNRNHFVSIGGLDCRFEHINFNTHDLAYRIQALGGKIHPSPTKVFSADWTPNDPVVSGAHYENDAPLFAKIYSQRAFDRGVSIDNWKEQANYWPRRNYKI